jgi:hypothetical protein
MRRAQITFDALNRETGEVHRGRIQGRRRRRGRTRPTGYRSDVDLVVQWRPQSDIAWAADPVLAASPEAVRRWVVSRVPRHLIAQAPLPSEHLKLSTEGGGHALSPSLSAAARPAGEESNSSGGPRRQRHQAAADHPPAAVWITRRHGLSQCRNASESPCRPATSCVLPPEVALEVPPALAAGIVVAGRVNDCADVDVPHIRVGQGSRAFEAETVRKTTAGGVEQVPCLARRDVPFRVAPSLKPSQ